MSMVSLAPDAPGAEMLRQMAADALDLVVLVARDAAGTVRVTRIDEVTGGMMAKDKDIETMNAWAWADRLSEGTPEFLLRERYSPSGNLKAKLDAYGSRPLVL